MKIRHFFKALSSALVISLAMSSCEKENLLSPADDATDEYVEVALNCTGEIIDQGQTPLSRAGGDDLYYVQVFEIDEIDGKDGIEYNYMPIKHGLFDYNPSGLKIKLKDGKRYAFNATMVENGKNLIFSEGTYYYAPFVCNLTNSFTETTGFAYFEEYGYAYASCLGFACVCLEEGKYGLYETPMLTRYFGKAEYIAGEGGSIQIKMLKMVFGLNIKMEGFSEGKLVVNIEGARSLGIEVGSNIETQIFSLFDLYSAYNTDYNETKVTNNYTQVLTVEVYWIDNSGVWHTVAIKPVKFYRNMKTTIVISKANVPMEESGFSIDIKEPELTDDPDEEIFDYGN